MRYQDAVCAVEIAEKGIIPGAGITLLQISNELVPKTDGENIIKKAIAKPFYQILENADIDHSEILITIKEANFNKICNITENKYEDIKTTSVLDPTEVVLSSIRNACSIASILLTTSSLIIHEYQNELNKYNNYDEI